MVHRTPSAMAELLGEVLEAVGVPYALERRGEVREHRDRWGARGRPRCATDAGEPRDLLAWLRAPGLVERREPVDRLEARARREGVESAAPARAIWEAEHWRLEALDRLREAAEQRRPPGRAAPCEGGAGRTREARAGRGPAPPRGEASAAMLACDELDEARALVAGRRALGELGELARAAPELGVDAAELVGAAGGTGDPQRRARETGRVAVVDPLALRARRVQGAVCVWPAGGSLPGERTDRAAPRRGGASTAGGNLWATVGPAGGCVGGGALRALRGGVAAGGARRAQLARGERRRCAPGEVALRRRRDRSVRRGVGGAARAQAAGGGGLARVRRSRVDAGRFWIGGERSQARRAGTPSRRSTVGRAGAKPAGAAARRGVAG